MTPIGLYQDRLNTCAAAMVAGDFDAWVQMLDLPWLFCTLRADFVLATDEELRLVFDSLTLLLRANRATHYERSARDAVMVRPDRIEGWHFSHVIADGEWITAPLAARHMMVRRDGVWLFSEAHYPFDTDTLPLTEEVVRAAIRPGLVPGGTALVAGLPRGPQRSGPAQPFSALPGLHTERVAG